ncbi:MAG: thiazole biosynthesis protein [Candidatus Lokiarchaeota archaeon]|nr:thiazole biosynthesis protein [Candidatus Lokiarchaeota archaeon]
MMDNLKPVSEVDITRAIIKKATDDWLELAESDVIIVGAGPSGLIAAKILAENGLKTVIFERRLSFGGGIGGGGMLFHKLVIQDPASDILKEVGCRLEKISEGFYTTDTAEMIAKLSASVMDAGAKMILGITVDDVMFDINPLRITGAVIQWVSVIMSGIHVDPLCVASKALVDATGHDAEILAVASRKNPDLNLLTLGEKSMNSKIGEELIIEKTGKVFPGLYATGMAVGTLYNTPRMGPIFGGMLLSGKKVAEEIIKDLKR